MQNKRPIKRTKRERTQTHLAEVEKQMAYASALFLNIGDGAIATNEQGKISRINDPALKILGYTREEAIGEWFQKLIIAQDEHGNDIDLMNRPITQAILSGKPISTKMFYKPKDGRSIPVAVTVSPIILNGVPNGAVEVFRDITREHEVDAMKSEFISLASHQLRTPLTAISTYTHMLLQGFKGPVSDDQRDFLETILASSDRMNELSDTLLTVSRLESGYVQVNMSQVNVSALIRGTKQELWPLAKTKRQYLITKSPAKDVHLRTDALLLTEICTNIISNAIKYTAEEGTVTITLTQDETSVVITVEDNGYGIPEELQNRVFTKFFRAPNILKEEAVGTGLGLYMVKELTENLGGEITFQSKENVGTTFQVRLPKEENSHARESIQII
jgi:PAS domain S-box-containing protein